MKTTIAMLTVATLGILAMPLQADHKLPITSHFDRIDQRIANQHYRIRDGIGNGTLTSREARHLRHHQRYILSLKHYFMSDGYLDRHEFLELREELERASKHIYRLKHNKRNRSARRYYY